MELSAAHEKQRPLLLPLNIGIRVRPINQYCRLIGSAKDRNPNIGSADYKGPYWLISIGIKRAQIWANLNPSKRFEPLKYFDPCLETFEL